VRAGTITLRIDDVLVAVGVDSDEGLATVRAAFGDWVDDTQPDVAPTFDLRLVESPDRRARSVPQLRRGASVVARSRSADHVIAALDSMLGGVCLHRSDHSRTWTFLRPFVAGRRMVLVDARAPMLVNDPMLERAGIVELATWVVAITGSEPDSGGLIAEVPPSLSAIPDVSAAYDLVGMVLVDRALGGQAPGALLARYGARHTSPEWFRAIADLLAGDRIVTSPDRIAARQSITALLAPD